MPIYAYRCTTCGHAKDVLQKISDPLLTDCPACGAVSFVKQVTAAGFQLKGSGWYVTDFRGGSKPEAEAGDKAATEKAPDKPAESSTAASGDKPTATPATPATAPAAPATAAPAATATAPAPPAASPPSSGG